MLRVMLASLGLGLGTSAVVHAQDAEEPRQPLLEFRFAGVDAIDVAPKDRAALAALRQVGERLSELPEELDNDDEPGPLIRAGWYTFLGGMGLDVLPSDVAPGVSLALGMNPAEPYSANELVGLLGAIAEREAMPVEIEEGMLSIASPFGPISFTAENAAANLRFGTQDAASMQVRTDGLPAGAKGVLSIRSDVQAISGMVLPFVAMQAPQVVQQLEASGLTGPNAIGVTEFAIGTTETHLHTYQRATNARAAMGSWSMSSDTTIRMIDLGMVPEDATRVIAGAFDLTHPLNMLEMQAQQLGEDPWAMIEEQTGINLKTDVLENVGPRVVMYQSDSTGGGGAMSTVVVAELKNARAFADAHERAKSMLNDLTAAEAKGYVRVSDWSYGRGTAFTLSTPGVPIPLELSWTVFDSRLVLAASPVGLVSAIEQIVNPETTIASNNKFRESVAQMMPARGVTTLMFSDSERFAGNGYSALNLAMSALANGVQSPGGGREMGVLMPPYHEFMKDIKPFGSVGYLQGEDWIAKSSGDRSVLVHAAGVMSNFGGGQGALAAGALGVGVALPALGRARESARQLKGATQVRGIVQGATLYSQNNDDRYPDNIEMLLDAGLITPEMLESPLGPVADGGPDIVLRTGIEVSWSATQIVAMDRAMYINGNDVVNVGFADNHVEAMSRGELEAALDQPENEGIRELFGLRDAGDGEAPSW